MTSTANIDGLTNTQVEYNVINLPHTILCFRRKKLSLPQKLKRFFNDDPQHDLF